MGLIKNRKTTFNDSASQTRQLWHQVTLLAHMYRPRRRFLLRWTPRGLQESLNVSMRKTACGISKYIFEASSDLRPDVIRLTTYRGDGLVGLTSPVWKASGCLLGSLTLVRGFILGERFICHHVNLWTSCNLIEYEHRIWLVWYVTSAAHLVSRFPTHWMCPFYIHTFLPVSKPLLSDLFLSWCPYAHYIFIYSIPFFIPHISQEIACPSKA